MGTVGGRIAPWGVVVLALAVTACGSGSSSVAKTAAPSASNTSVAPRTAEAFDFCRLVTSAEAQAAVGTPLKVGIRSSEITPLGHGGGCVYASISFTEKSQTLVNIGFYGNKISRSQFDQEVASRLGAQAKPVPGLGEAAIHVDGVVVVFDRGSALQIQIVKDNVPSTDLVLLTGLARKALERSSEVR